MVDLKTIGRRVRGLWEPPRIKVLEQAHAVALGGGRTPVRVVTRGTGRLVVGDVRLFVAGDFDDVLLVPAVPEIFAQLRNLRGDDVKLLKLEGLDVAPPARVRLPHDGVGLFGEFAPALHEPHTVHLPLQTPHVRAHAVDVPHAPALSPTPLARGRHALPLVRTTALRPRVDLGDRGRQVGADALADDATNLFGRHDFDLDPGAER